MGEIVNSERFKNTRSELWSLYNSLDPKLNEYRRLARLDLFSRNMESMPESQIKHIRGQWINFLNHEGVNQLLKKAADHTATKEECNKLIRIMESQGLWP